MSKKRIAGIAVGGVLSVALLAGGIGVVAYAITPDTHPYVSVTQSHEISAGAIEDTQLAASTSREANAWTATQELAAKKAAEAKAAADALAAQQAAAAAAAQQAAEQAAAQKQAAQSDSTTYSTDSRSTDTPDPLPTIATPGSSDGGRIDTSSCGTAGANYDPATGQSTCAG